MKKNVSLKELNAKGQLICKFVEVAFVNSSICRHPFLHKSNDPTTCYLHYYNDMYFVTDHILSTRQDFYSSYEDALNRFHELIARLRR